MAKSPDGFENTQFLWTWVVFGCRGTKLEGVSASTWKCEVGGGPMGVGRLSESTW